MEFSKEFLSNSMFNEQPVSFNPVRAARVGKGPDAKSVKSGLEYLENGDIRFLVYSPKAETVSVKVANRTVDLEKDADGMFSGILPYDEHFAGPHSTDVIIDGEAWISPYLPVFWHRNRPVNFVEVPDPETPYAMIQDVPHGAIAYETYWSKTLKSWQRCTVYTPAGCRTSGKRYPVLYLQHGATEDETVWVYNGRVAEVMDNMIAAGRCEEMIVVMNDGMVSYPNGEKPEGSEGAFADSLLSSCIPYIDANYPTKTDKWSRAIAGLSMGSGQCSSIAYRHPDLFGYIGMFSGRLGLHTGRGLETRDDPELMALVSDIEQFEKNFKVVFRGMGDQDATSMFPNFFEDDKVVERLGWDKLPTYTRKIYPYQTHEFGAWRRMLYDYAPLLFR